MWKKSLTSLFGWDTICGLYSVSELVVQVVVTPGSVFPLCSFSCFLDWLGFQPALGLGRVDARWCISLWDQWLPAPYLPLSRWEVQWGPVSSSETPWGRSSRAQWGTGKRWGQKLKASSRGSGSAFSPSDGNRLSESEGKPQPHVTQMEQHEVKNTAQ